MSEAERYIRVKNWDTFQHYKDRNPPWIKLATNTFQNYGFSRLQDASKLLAVCIWTLAARSEVCKEGEIPYDLAWIKSQCGLGNLITDKHMQELESKGFIVCDSAMLASCKQNACLEGEGEGEGEAEGEAEAEAAKPDPITVIADRVREDWNAAAKTRDGWSQCTKRPAGEIGKLLMARCEDPEWLADYPRALELMTKLEWMKNGKLSTFVRPDTVRKLIDEEWRNDDNKKRDIAERHAEYDGAF